MYSLPIEVPQEQIVRLCQRYSIQRLALFGSVLRADFRPESDIDVLVEFHPGKTPGFGIVRIQQELTDLMQRPVDLRTPKELSRYFRQRVLEEALNLYVAA